MKLSYPTFKASRCPKMGSIGKDGQTNVKKNTKRKTKRRTPRLTGVSKQRKMANERERRRVHTLNTHIESLRDLIPLSPFEKRLTKTEVIWMAAIYIGFLAELLEKTKNADDNKPESVDDVSQSLDLTFVDFSVSDVIGLDENSAMSTVDLEDLIFLADSEVSLSET